jgi:hypothetical protein
VLHTPMLKSPWLLQHPPWDVWAKVNKEANFGVYILKERLKNLPVSA